MCLELFPTLRANGLLHRKRFKLVATRVDELDEKMDVPRRTTAYLKSLQAIIKDEESSEFERIVKATQFTAARFQLLSDKKSLSTNEQDVLHDYGITLANNGMESHGIEHLRNELKALSANESIVVKTFDNRLDKLLSPVR
jgi:hypothetical protein